ncbi:helix-turn-helix domain-containing protein [Brasilonema sp. UFV-L1]|uniref:helix-turn-helix domain-containing protein n=1 Tax=Brasilonema sp. UFV-L1 TaxID=2234130 RepID=UPI002006EFD4
MIHLRQFTTFQLLGIQFGVSETTANDTFNYWFPLIRELLPSSLLEQVRGLTRKNWAGLLRYPVLTPR